MSAVSYHKSTENQVSLIRKELVALTQDSQVAVVLNQLLYWTQRVKDFDLFLEEERTANPEDNAPLNYGWMYKTADELIEETLLTVTRPTMRKYLRILVEEGWMEEKTNPDRKWDRTAHFRLNLRKISEELGVLGYRLPGFEKDLFDDGNQEERNLTSRLENLTSKEENLPSELKNLTGQEGSVSPKLRNLTSRLENLTSKEKNFTPKLRNLTSKLENLPPKLKNLTAYTYTETTSENTNREHTQDACARENFSDFENSKNSELENSTPGEPVSNKSGQNESVPDESVAEEMIRLWEYHVVQKLEPTNWKGVLHLTEERKDQLESLFAFHFQNDIRLWERFCLRVKASNFLMGGGPNGWRVSLDWILLDRNLLKILEGNFDDSKRFEPQGSHEGGSHEWDLAKMQPNPVKDAEKATIIASIKDPVWRNWCSRLAEGVRLNDLQMLQPPLSLAELSQIVNARFLECEDERLVWVGSPDQGTLNKIEYLRLKINWVFAEEYPKARTLRTRLLEEILSPTPTQQQGDVHHA